MANEKRLIDANAIHYEEYYVPDPDSDVQWDFKKELCVYKSAIDKMPTVDAVEVVHGRWVKKTEDYVYYYACSECGEPVLKSQWGHDFFSDYCPNCGAKMDGDGNV